MVYILDWDGGKDQTSIFQSVYTFLLQSITFLIAILLLSLLTVIEAEVLCFKVKNNGNR